MSNKSDLGSESPQTNSKFSPKSIKSNSTRSQSIVWSEKSLIEIDMEYDERQRKRKEMLAEMEWSKAKHELARTPVKVLNQNGSELVSNMDTSQVKDIAGTSKVVEHEMTNISQVMPEKVQTESELKVNVGYPDQGNLNVQFEHKRSDNDELMPKKVVKAKGVKSKADIEVHGGFGDKTADF